MTNLRSLVACGLALSTLTTMTPTRAAGQDLCRGLVTDKAAHPRTPRLMPPYNVWVKDPDIVNPGVRIKRITDVVWNRQVGKSPVVKPLYSPVPAWNIDESYLLLWSGPGTVSPSPGYWVYDGATYEPIRKLTTLTPSGGVEIARWSGTDPNYIYYTGNAVFNFYRVDVRNDTRTTVKNFDAYCTAGQGFGMAPHGTVSSI